MGGVGSSGLRDRLFDTVRSDTGIHASARDGKGKRETRMRNTRPSPLIQKRLSEVRPGFPKNPPSVDTIIRKEWQISLCAERHLPFSIGGNEDVKSLRDFSHRVLR